MNNHLDYGKLIHFINKDKIRGLGRYLGKVRNKWLMEQKKGKYISIKL